MKVHIELVEILENHSPEGLTELNLSATDLTDRMDRGIPFLEGREDELDLSAAYPLFAALTSWSGLGHAKSVFKRAARNLSDHEMMNLLRVWLKGEEPYITHFASRHQLPVDVLYVVLRYSLLPTLAFYSKQFYDSGRFDDERWMKSYCPVCGDRQGLAEFRGDERFRHFRCLSCTADWKYWRIGCPYCHNRDHDRLSSWFIQEDIGHFQIDLCENCRGYVKGINKIEPSSLPFLILDDILTTSLDLLAQEKGYLPGGENKQMVQ